jgi:hypothetical protein
LTMSDLAITLVLVAAAASSSWSAAVWIGLTLTGVAWIGHAALQRRGPAGDAMAVTIWGSAELDADRAAAVRLDGRNPIPHPADQDMFRGLAPWMQRCRAAAAHRHGQGAHVFAAVSGISAATCATIGKMSLPELAERGVPRRHCHRFAGRARGTLGLLIPPSSS